MPTAPRASETERLILELLLDHGPQYGLSLVKQSRGRLKRGTVYVTLGRMEQKGLVESHAEEREPGTPGLPRRFYRPTRAGVAVVRAAELAAALMMDPEFQP